MASKSTKNGTKKSKKSSVASGGIARVPSQGAPKPPAGYAPKAGSLKNRPHPPHALVAMAAGVASELRSSSTYVEEFGKNAPSKGDLADRVEATAGWVGHVEPAATWLTYVKDQASRGWQATVQRLYELEPAFTYASERDPSVVERYPTLAALFALPKAAAKRAAATRAAQRKAKSAPPAAKPPETPAEPPTETVH